MACGGALTSRELRFSIAETTFLVRESGAVIVAKRQVGTYSNGKVVDNRGRVVAWVHGDSIRIRGGVTLPIRTDPDGGVYVPVSAQEKAGLDPMVYRIRANGTMAQTQGAQGVPIEGHMTPAKQRLVLLLMILTRNSRWS